MRILATNWHPFQRPSPAHLSESRTMVLLGKQDQGNQKTSKNPIRAICENGGIDKTDPHPLLASQAAGRLLRL